MSNGGDRGQGANFFKQRERELLELIRMRGLSKQVSNREEMTQPGRKKYGYRSWRWLSIGVPRQPAHRSHPGVDTALDKASDSWGHTGQSCPKKPPCRGPEGTPGDAALAGTPVQPQGWPCKGWGGLGPGGVAPFLRRVASWPLLQLWVMVKTPGFESNIISSIAQLTSPVPHHHSQPMTSW